ncbi:MAG: hypothetical protein ACK4SZ_06885 [Allosphingosinicella sp.]|uniref:hypothetical protein n=1 Tax=Allosphingosinicella sp. TaxID=2823234 RepID=UPI00394939F3
MIVRGNLILLTFAALAACNDDGAEWPYVVDDRSGVAIVTETPEGEQRLRNATTDYGVFFVEGNCLQVRLESGVMTPVFPRGSSFDSGAGEVLVGGRRFQLGQRYSLPFAAEIGTGAGEAAAAIGLPPGCSRRLLAMGSPA